MLVENLPRVDNLGQTLFLTEGSLKGPSCAGKDRSVLGTEPPLTTALPLATRVSVGGVSFTGSLQLFTPCTPSERTSGRWRVSHSKDWSCPKPQETRKQHFGSGLALLRFCSPFPATAPHGIITFCLNSLFSYVHFRPRALWSKHCLEFVHYCWACLGQSLVNICWMTRWMDRHWINEQGNLEALNSGWKKKVFSFFLIIHFPNSYYMYCGFREQSVQFNSVPCV